MKRTPPRRNHGILTAAAALLTVSAFPADAQQRGRTNTGDPRVPRATPVDLNERRVAPQPNPRNPTRTPRPAPVGRTDGGSRPVDFPVEFREISGTGNNMANPLWGAADTELLRRAGADYADGVSEPSGADRPSARAVSNACAAQPDMRPNASAASDFLWQWGQFLDHDIDLTESATPAEPFDIPVPAGDPFFDPDGSGDRTIGLNRSHYVVTNGVRQQVNTITAFIDASNVYGSDETRAFALRMLDGSGRLKTSEGGLLPFNTEGLENAPSGAIPTFFLAGDIRANEQIGLTAMHTLFVREHNHWAATLAEADPLLSGEQIYQMARSIVAAEMQAVTYNEFLPVLLGRDAIPPYRGYREEVNAGIANVFSTAAYRFGHTLLSPELLRLGADGQPVAVGNIALADAFFNPAAVVESGIAPLLRGLAAQQCQELDTMLVDDVRNFLFGAPGAGGFDLASLNIQRGRDHGLPSYAEVRRQYGLPPARNFGDVSRNPDVRRRLAEVYENVQQVDAWVGMLAEDHVPGAMTGPTIRAVLVDQFTRLRNGDRFWYQHDLPENLAGLVEEQTLAVIIRRNTEIGAELQENVFLVP